MIHEPARVDYVLLTVTPDERDGARAVFCLENYVPGPLPYVWGELEHVTHSRNVIVAHVSLNDAQGLISSSDITREIMEHICPTNIIVIGIAGGISTKREQIPLAGIVIPNIVHTGPFKASGPRASPTIPPSPQLYKSIWPIAETLDWVKYIGINPPDGSTKPPVVSNGELVSSDSNLSGISDATLRKILRGYPRARAVEMEIGGVAYTLGSASSVKEQNRPNYLAIKSISDIVYDAESDDEARKIAARWVNDHCSGSEFDTETKNAILQDLTIGFSKPPPEEEDLNQEERDKWKAYASRVSAALAKRFIEVNPIPKKPIPIHRMWNDSVREGIGFFNNSMGVLTRVGTESYSRLATDLLTRYGNDVDDDFHFFTVCAFSPKRLYDFAYVKYKRSHNGREPRASELVDFARREFVHFRAFSEHAANNPGKCVRILLSEEDLNSNVNGTQYDTDDALKRRTEAKKYEQFFKVLNGRVPCWILDKSDVNYEKFLTDYVIIGEEVLLDYYEESGIVHVGDLTDKDVGGYFINLFSEFKRDFGAGRKQRRSMFKPYLNRTAWYGAFGHEAGQAA